MKKLTFIKAFFSPFKRPRLKWYFGKIAIGTPYFYPRRWKKPNRKMAMEYATRELEKLEKRNKENPEYSVELTYEDLYKDAFRFYFSMPKKIGFDFVGLGYKIKRSNTDYRFEWSPLVSFVFWKWQIAVMVVPPEQNHYWEAWLYYENNTDKTKSPKERIKQCREEFSMKYITFSKEGKKEIDYYDLLLKQTIQENDEEQHFPEGKNIAKMIKIEYGY